MLYRDCGTCKGAKEVFTSVAACLRDGMPLYGPETCPACAGVGFVPVAVTREEIARIVAPCGPWHHLGSIIQGESYRKADAVIAMLGGGA